jgi:hypothetical protein
VKIDDYLRRVRKVRGAIRPGKVTALIVRHDDWCPCVNGNHPMTDCICDPDIEVGQL